MVKQIIDLVSTLPAVNYEMHHIGSLQVSGLCIDSREVQSGDLFFALQGLHFDADAFIEKAILNGAEAICCDKGSMESVLAVLPKGFPLLVVEDLLANLSQIANIFYDDPSSHMHVVAITGTDGKTSVSHFIAQLLEQSAVVGTMGNGRLDKLQTASHTTPNAIALQALMQEFRMTGIKSVSMEASSHGLSQGRLNAIDVDTAVLTNFSRDHLDYHGSIEAYKSAKKILFTEFKPKNMVVNYDDEFGKEIIEESTENTRSKFIPYTLESAETHTSLIKAKIINTLPTGFRLNISYKNTEQLVELQLLGKFNIENAIAALAVAISAGMPFTNACRKLEKLTAIAGRMQAINIINKCHVVIDYAHTPQALKSALHAVSTHCDGKVICVFGCGGDRDKGKRSLMAEAASCANYVIITNDNPRTEDPVAIVNDICAGFNEFNNYEIEYDRTKAIHIAINKAGKKDVVLIAGKGHEQYQIIGDKQIAYSDETVVRDYIGLAA